MGIECVGVLVELCLYWILCIIVWEFEFQSVWIVVNLFVVSFYHCPSQLMIYLSFNTEKMERWWFWGQLALSSTAKPNLVFPWVIKVILFVLPAECFFFEEIVFLARLVSNRWGIVVNIARVRWFCKFIPSFVVKTHQFTLLTELIVGFDSTLFRVGSQNTFTPPIKFFISESIHLTAKNAF